MANSVDHVSEAKRGNTNKTEVGYVFNWKLPEYSFDDIIGLPFVKQNIDFKVLLPFTHPEFPRTKGTRNVFGVLLFGPEGNGKTVLTNAIARELGANFCSVSPSEIITNNVEESVARINTLFETAALSERAVICFEDIECISPDDSEMEIYREIEKAIMSSMDKALDVFKKRNNVLVVVGCTNKPYKMNNTLFAKKYFSKKIHVDLPDPYTRKCLILSVIKDYKEYIEKVNLNLDLLIRQFDGFSSAEIIFLIKKAIKLAYDRSQETKCFALLSEDFDKVLSNAKCMVSESKLEKISAWMKFMGC